MPAQRQHLRARPGPSLPCGWGGHDLRVPCPQRARASGLGRQERPEAGSQAAHTAETPSGRWGPPAGLSPTSL